MDSDGAGDQVNEELLRIKKRLIKKLKSRRGESERRGVAELVKRLKSAFLLEPVNTGPMYVELAEAAIISLQRMLDDEGYIGSWRSPAAAEGALKKQIEGLEKSIDDVRRKM